MYGKLLAYLRDHRTRQYFYNFSEDSAALTSRDLTVFGYCVARGMEYLASKKVRILSGQFPIRTLEFIKIQLSLSNDTIRLGESVKSQLTLMLVGTADTLLMFIFHIYGRE